VACTSRPTPRTSTGRTKRTPAAGIRAHGDLDGTDRVERLAAPTVPTQTETAAPDTTAYATRAGNRSRDDSPTIRSSPLRSTSLNSRLFTGASPRKPQPKPVVLRKIQANARRRTQYPEPRAKSKSSRSAPPSHLRRGPRPACTPSETITFQAIGRREVIQHYGRPARCRCPKQQQSRPAHQPSLSSRQAPTPAGTPAQPAPARAFRRADGRCGSAIR